jgi:opacity protein-like surface antigen
MKVWSPRGGFLPHRRYRIKPRPSFCARLRTVAAAAVLALLLPCCASRSAFAQRETASRIGDLQLGGGFVFASSNYNFTPIHLTGAAFYTTFDVRNHWGGEFDLRQNNSTAGNSVYERTYEIGPRVFLARGPIIPYAKVLFGRGVYNFPNNVANVAYNVYTFGGGADFDLRRSLKLRVDYEYQTWMGFPITDLHPSVVTVGVAYHFHE